MSLPPQVNTDKSGKHRAAAMKEPVQHPGEVYYGMGPPALESSHSDSTSSSAVYNPEKGPQSLPHYQQAAPVKWMHQDSLQAPGWSQEAPVPAWGQNLTFTPPYMGGVNVRGQMAFHKGGHEGVVLPMGGENQLPGPIEVYRDTSQAQAQGRGHEWEQHAAAAMHQAQLQAYQHGHKGVELQGQSHAPSHSLQGSMLQPFQTTFRPSKQQFSSGFYSAFPGNKAMPSLAYSEQPKTQQQLLHQMQQQQQQQQQMHHRQQQQQQLHQQHHLQLQQQQHLQQQQQQIQQHQMQQQQLQQMQHQYHQQQIQERQQQIQQMQQQQQLQQQNVPQQETTQVQVQPKQQQTQDFAAYQSPEPCTPDSVSKREDVQSVKPQLEPESQTCNVSAVPNLCPEKVATNPGETSDAQSTAPRRSRRLSRDGQSPLGPPSTNIWSQATKEPSPSQNGVSGIQRGGESQVTTGGVIQITRRRRRASKEINLETLAQKASEMESLPAKTVKEDGPSGKQANMVPLVIPVSVPVQKGSTDGQGSWTQGRLSQTERPAGQTNHKPSVIVARRRSLRNFMTESFVQDGENNPGVDEDGKSKFRRRPRPEPLIIPPPKPSTFIPPSIYSSITSYQSNLRSPVRLPDNPVTLPPYTPPPILSPVREGTGLYFSTFLTNIAVSNQILPPPATPKSAARSLLRSTSSEITPPVLPLIADATPVSLEPRINIGQHYQAEIPDLQEQLSSQFDHHKADLVWCPVDNSHSKIGDHDSLDDLMNMACSSVLRGGGTNQELVLHCLHECRGDFLETLGRLMLQDPVFPKGHHLAGYHYSGSDSWTAEEKRYFNKGISAYRKDFFLVQNLVRTKTVAQCVEFYYTYKKQVKISRNGILTFGPPDSPVEKHAEAMVDIKSSQQSKMTQGEADGDDKKDVSYDQSHESSQQARVAQSLQAHDYAGTVLVIKEPDTVNKDTHTLSAPHRPRAEPAVKKSKTPVKAPQDPDAIFPCKKCGRVFYKVKSRSAHMKSHAEQEKKAAALRQKEQEEQAAAEARARKVAVAVAAAAAAAAEAHLGGKGDGLTDQADVSSQDDSSEGEDDNDADWH